MSRTAQNARLLEGAMAEIAWTQEPDEHGYQRHRSVVQAKRHLASLSPERRAMLQAEWEN